MQANSVERRRQYCFGAFTLDLDAGFLRCGNKEVALRPKSFEVLAYLVERHGRLVSREDLLRAVWPDVAVTDEGVTKCIADIRKAVEDDAQQLIRTVARRGYVFTASVTTPAMEFPYQAGRETELGPVPLRPIIHAAPLPLLEDVSATLRPGKQRQISETAQEDDLKHVPLHRAWVVAALLIAVGSAVMGFRMAHSGRGNNPGEPEYTQLTNFTDAAFSPALSPDGRMLVFIRGDNLATVGGEGNIYIKLLPDGEPVQLTHDDKNKMTPAFTPGADRIVYGVPAPMVDPTNWTTWTVSVFGGEPKLMMSNASALTWIPGVFPPRILFSQVDKGIHMSIVTSAENRTESRTVYSPATVGGMAHRSFLSPDHKHMLVVEMASGWRPCRLVPFEPAGQSDSTPAADSTRGAGKLVGPSPGQCSSAAWSPDGTWMYFSVNTGNGYHIWRQKFPNGAPEQVTFGATEEQEIAFAADGRSFLTSAGIRQSTLWVHDARGERQISSQGYASLPRFSPVDAKLYFLLRTGANQRYVSGELWAADLETSQRERLLPGFLLTDYSISPDGNRILFVAIADKGDTSVWLARLDGRTPPRRLSAIAANRAFFGAKGEVVFSSEESGGRRFIYRVREDGSGLQKAIPDPITYAYDVSPDGKALAAWPETAVQIFYTDGSPPVNASAV